ncbi:hypothetical protein AAG570_007784 [Ranatra chinensis]|uniref:Translation initiation factor 3 N-terminal domain-containing protein n=1 Tax=Ranatra chinensis TaxID=642074 RepID=A0ABD0XUI2_9HEMI
MIYNSLAKNPVPCTVTRPHFSSESSSKVEEKQKSKKPIVEYVTLIDLDKKIKLVTLMEATKLATRRSLKLIKVKDFDPQRQTPIYKIITSSEYLKEEINLKKFKAKDTAWKAKKIMTFSNKISDHDLSFKLRQIAKWLEKNYEVQITISGVEPKDPSTEELFKKMELILKDTGRIIQKRHSGNDIKCQVIPPKQNTSKYKEIEY